VAEKVETNNIKSISKAIKILNLFTERANSWRITDVAAELNIPKSTVCAIVKSLERLYILEQINGSYYKLGVGIFQLGYVARIGSEVYQSITPLLEELYDRTGLITYFAISHLGQILYIDSVYHSAQRKLGYSVAGRTSYMHCTGLGKAMLAQAEPEHVEAIIDTMGLPKLTDYTITDPEKFKEELRAIKERGYAVDLREADPMIGCVAMSFKTRDGQLGGAISVSGSYLAFNETTIPGYVDSLAYICSELSRRVERLPFKVRLVGDKNEKLT
jgi:DNA-binding IclR family transcriptional regulator